jgi:ubiquinone/menaquinone biosynthesis C-methylase UbiE
MTTDTDLKTRFPALLGEFESSMRRLPDNGLYKYAKLMCAVHVFDALEKICLDMNKNPYAVLTPCLEKQVAFLAAVDPGLAFILAGRDGKVQVPLRDDVQKLYEEAWTVYDPASYAHSVELIKGRLAINGLDEDFVRGKKCFDGGCGTGRFSIALAQLGASRVVGADIGSASLDFARERVKEYGLENIEFVRQDVTDLSPWEDGEFDFVISNGVLHHTIEQVRGVKEHFRVTRPGGHFWLYLYGAGSLYWEVYDLLMDLVSGIGHPEAKHVMQEFLLRPGSVYTFLDNVYAPIRKYYTLSQVQQILKEEGSFTTRLLEGPEDFDSAPRQLSSLYGREIFGPEGEVRAMFVKE